MIDALWAVTFKSHDQYHGFGVVALDSAKVLGGDTSFSYIGDYQVGNGQITVNLHIKRYAPGLPNVFRGNTDYRITMTGAVAAENITLMGFHSNDGILIATLRRIAELPEKNHICPATNPESLFAGARQGSAFGCDSSTKS